MNKFYKSFCHTKQNYRKWGLHFDVAVSEKEIANLEELTVNPEFWNNAEESQKILKKIKFLKNKISAFKKLEGDYEDVITLLVLAKEENDESLLAEIKKGMKDFLNDYENMRIKTLLSEPYDKNNAILSLHAGAGGTEACDWVDMLYRMYTRWAVSQEYSLEVLDYLSGDEAGTKSVTISVNGENAYGYLKGEKGVHRLIRISPFDSSGKRHTSFASCDVMPEIEDDNTVEINTEDLRIDTYRASGAGGQHVNKTDSAIRITHLPTNIVVQCQNERSQLKNKDAAMKMLRAKLLERKMQEQAEELQDLRGEMKDISWGSQIRTYVFHPYNMVKDHRTGVEIGNTGSVMDGNLDLFINGYLVWRK